MTHYTRCQCKTGDHDLDGKSDRCLNDAGKGHRLCADCRVKGSVYLGKPKGTA